jgi:hypothetical protein
VQYHLPEFLVWALVYQAESGDHAKSRWPAARHVTSTTPLGGSGPRPCKATAAKAVSEGVRVATMPALRTANAE